MSAAWALDLPSTDKMVLLALADSANDQGVTWIALKSRRADSFDLMQKCSLSERAIQGAVKRLCEAKLLSREERPGRGVIYKVTPAGDAPPQEMHPAAGAEPPAGDAGTPAAGAGKPSTPVKEPSKLARKRASVVVQIPHWVPPEPWLAFVAMRKSIPKVPFTDDAAKGIIEDLDLLRAQGHDPGKLLKKAVKRGWRGVFPGDDTMAAAHPGASNGRLDWTAEEKAECAAINAEFERLEAAPYDRAAKDAWFSRKQHFYENVGKGGKRERATGPPRSIGDLVGKIAREGVGHGKA